MPAYLYASNVSPRERFTRIELQLDNGSTAIIHRGHSYDLSAAEVSRVSSFVVLTPVGSADSDPVEVVRLPVVGVPEEGDVPVWRAAYGAFVTEPQTGGGGVDGLLVFTTADTNEQFKIIGQSSGTLRGVPKDSEPPLAPLSLTADVKLSSVKLAWQGVASAQTYSVYRSGVIIGSSSTPSYRDMNPVIGASYQYSVRAVNAYGQISGFSSLVNVFIDPSINSAPTIDIRTWPSELPSTGTAIVRVNAVDVDAQQLAYALNVDVGFLMPTDDPSVWTLSVA